MNAHGPRWSRTPTIPVRNHAVIVNAIDAHLATRMLSLRGLADRMKIAHSTLARFRKGELYRIKAPTPFIEALSRELGIDVAALASQADVDRCWCDACRGSFRLDIHPSLVESFALKLSSVADGLGMSPSAARALAVLMLAWLLERNDGQSALAESLYQHAVDSFRSAGLPSCAEKALRELPVPTS